MTKIRPFKAITYNQEKIKDLSNVICPPYDVISPAKQQDFYGKSDYNLIRILLTKDNPGTDKYKNAAADFKDWLKNGIFIEDKTPAIYFYSQEYRIQREKKTRLGFISLLRLGVNDSDVYRHEHTRLAPKEDRFRLMKQVKANLSPIFVIFPDKQRIIQRAYQQQIRDKKPFIEVIDDEKTLHKLWRIDSPEAVAKIQNGLADENIFIADGHHRYEVACAYRDEMKQKLGEKAAGDEGFNYVMAYFTNTDQRGLSILPIHRLLKLDPGMDISKLLSLIGEYFDVKEVKDRVKFFFLMEKGGRTEHVLGMYKDKRYFLLRLKNVRILDKMLSDKPKDYRSLDVCILNSIIFDKLLGIDPAKKENVIFSPHADEFIEEADKDKSSVAFFLNSVKIEQIMSVALNRERMPAKSTYFYPKVLSGLLINKLE